MEKIKKYKNVFVIEDAKSTISLEELLHDKVNKEAKKFNWIYSHCNLLTDSVYEEKVKNGTLVIDKSSEQDAWKNLKLVFRNSNRALAYHQEIKELYMQGKNFEQYFGTEGIFLKDRGDVWTCESAGKVAELQNNKAKYPSIYLRIIEIRTS